MATAAVPSSKPIALKRIERNEEAVTTLDLALDADGSNGISKDVSSATRLLLTCEHASNYVMAPWSWLQADAHLMNDHWASDPGAEEFTRELHTRLPSLAVLSRFSRLLCDPNRPRESDTMFRAVADGRPIAMNAPERLTDEDRALRLERLYVPYHAALQQAATRCRPKTVLSIHSFTPVYEGQRRTVEVGVLYNADRDRPLAEKFLTAFRAGGMVAELNAPWSAKDGFMYAAEQFSSEETAVIMFEFRNDLATDPKWREKAIGITMQVLKEEGHQ